MGKILDRTGKRYGRLLVLERAEDVTYPNNQKRKIMWKCQCDCGKICYRSSDSLGSGTKSCGCLVTETAKRNLKNINSKKEKEKQINIGKRFGSLTIIQTEDTSKARPHDYWITQCDCGNIFSTLHRNITSGKYTDCGCQDLRYYRFKDISGQRFGKLIASRPIIEKEQSGKSKRWICQCDCGRETIVTADALQKGNTMSCGCLKSSQGELLIEQILKDNNISYEKEKVAFNYDTKGKARFDFFVNNEYFIEFDGEQHYKSNERWWNTLELVEKYKEYDAIKNKWCKDNNIPLIRIPYSHKNQIQLEDLILDTSKFIVC